MDACDLDRSDLIDQPLASYDIYLENWIGRGQFKQSFSNVFRAPQRNLCFRISDWVDQSAPIAMAYRFQRWRYSMRVSFIMPDGFVLGQRLAELARVLRTRIVIDIASDRHDNRCLVLDRKGKVRPGLFFEVGQERPDGCHPMRLELD